jgi:hypothetical protein
MTFPLILSFLVGSSAPAPIYFNHAPLGNVIRVISARFNVHIELDANAKTPITGDFSQLNLNQSLELAAKQACMDVVHLGHGASEAYELRLPQAPDKGSELADAARRRAELLRARTLLDHANNSQGGAGSAD